MESRSGIARAWSRVAEVSNVGRRGWRAEPCGALVKTTEIWLPRMLSGWGWRKIARRQLVAGWMPSLWSSQISHQLNRRGLNGGYQLRKRTTITLWQELSVEEGWDTEIGEEFGNIATRVETLRQSGCIHVAKGPSDQGQGVGYCRLISKSEVEAGHH